MIDDNSTGIEPRTLTVSNPGYGNGRIIMGIVAFSALIVRILIEPTLLDVGWAWVAIPVGSLWIYSGFESRVQKTISINGDSITFSKGDTMIFDLQWSEITAVANCTHTRRYDNIAFFRQDGEEFELHESRVDPDTLRSLFRAIVAGVKQHHPHIKIDDDAGWVHDGESAVTGFKFLK